MGVEKALVQLLLLSLKKYDENRGGWARGSAAARATHNKNQMKSRPLQTITFAKKQSRKKNV